MKEERVKKKINKMLKSLWDDVWIFMPVQMGMGVHGVPDHIAVAPVVVTEEMVGQTYGMAIGIEAKKPYLMPSPNQYTQLSLMTKAGSFANYCAGLTDIPIMERHIKKRFFIK